MNLISLLFSKDDDKTLMREVNEHAQARCQWYTVSRNEKIMAEKIGKDNTDLRGYCEMGCYDCNGYRDDCPAYLPIKVFDRRIEVR